MELPALLKMFDMTGKEIRDLKFRQTLRGYNIDDVDVLLEHAAKEVDAGRSPAELVGGASLRRSLRGYRVEDVDQALSLIGGA